MMSFWVTFIICLVFQVCIITILGDSDNLQDVCPTAPGKPSIFINGFSCKNPKEISAQDFKSSRLNQAGDTNNFHRSSVSLVTASELAGLNTLGLSVARIDIEVDGLVKPHSHPRSSELLVVYKGVMIAGFIDSENRIFQEVVKEGDVFVFPKGLLHFCLNSGFELATAFSVFNSQNPGVVSIGEAMFGFDQESFKKTVKRLISSVSETQMERCSKPEYEKGVVIS